MIRRDFTRLVFSGLAALWSGSPVAAQPVGSPGTAEVGILVMAHGGSSEWNETVSRAVAPLSRQAPTAVAFGMAEPETLQAGLDSLAALGVRRVAVVRMFISGASFLDQTLYLLGLSSTPPQRFISMRADHPGSSSIPPAPVSHSLEIATHVEGLMSSQHAGRIISHRATHVSDDSSTESVLVLAHGMGDDSENQKVLDAMETTLPEIESHGFQRVEAATLREDWDSEREVSEASIRAFVREQTTLGYRVIVVPYRLSGFGPYADVLAGLDYEQTDGLLPHPVITEWIGSTASRISSQNGWPDPLAPRAAPTQDPGAHGSRDGSM